MPRMKLLEPWNCRPVGAVVEVNLQVGAQLEKDKYATETDEPVSENPGAIVEVVEDDEPPRRRGRPPKVADDDA